MDQADGDDTFHALGATMLNARGSGTLGLHRGRGQGDFGADNCKQLDTVVIHLRRMLSMRSKLAAANREAGVWREGFLHTSLPTLVVDRTLRIRLRNANADLLLAERLETSLPDLATLPGLPALPALRPS